MSEIQRILEIDLSKSSRRGNLNTENIPIDALRSYCVSVRFNKEELELLNEKRGATKKVNGFAWHYCTGYLLLFHPSISKHGNALEICRIS